MISAAVLYLVTTSLEERSSSFSSLTSSSDDIWTNHPKGLEAATKTPGKRHEAARIEPPDTRGEFGEFLTASNPNRGRGGWRGESGGGGGRVEVLGLGFGRAWGLGALGSRQGRIRMEAEARVWGIRGGGWLRLEKRLGQRQREPSRDPCVGSGETLNGGSGPHG